jgi:voltage-gated potassium channel
MKEYLKFKLSRNVPIAIGSVVILNGIVHILVSACLLIKVPIPFFKQLQNIINFSAHRHTGVLLGIFFGFCLLIVGKGICEKKRKSWNLAILILIILGVNNLILQAIPQTNIICVVLLISLLVFKKYFTERDEIAMGYQQILAWISVMIAVAYGVCGSYFLRHEFSNIKTWTDAAYFTMVTYSTVGYGEMYPLTQHAKFFTVSMILVGLGSFATTFTFLIGPMIENRLKGVLSIMKKLNNIRNHVILCGYTNLSCALIKQFEEKGIPFIVLENSADKKAEIEQKYITVPGNTFQKDTFINAQINNAKTVITAFENDSDNILTLLTVKEILEESNNKVTRLISRIDNEENIEKAKKLGAAEIVSPTKMAANSIINSSFKSKKSA